MAVRDFVGGCGHLDHRVGQRAAKAEGYEHGDDDGHQRAQQHPLVGAGQRVYGSTAGYHDDGRTGGGGPQRNHGGRPGHSVSDPRCVGRFVGPSSILGQWTQVVVGDNAWKFVEDD